MHFLVVEKLIHKFLPYIFRISVKRIIIHIKLSGLTRAVSSPNYKKSPEIRKPPLVMAFR